MKQFTFDDTREHGCVAGAKSLSIDYPQDLKSDPLDWQKRGLQETASGYGARLRSTYKIHFEGKLRRIYHTCYGNASSAWIKVRGVKVFIN